MTTRTINLHVGPHKTATTHLQWLLTADPAWLEERDVAVYIARQTRPWMRSVVKFAIAPPWRRWGLARELREQAPQNSVWVVSNEHFGRSSPASLWKDVPLVRWLGPQVQRFQKLFPDRQVKVFLSLRSYESFLLSNFLEYFRNNGPVDFEDFRDHERFARYSWLDLVERLAAVIDPRHITVWKFEDIGALSERLVVELTGQEDVSGLFSAYRPRATRRSLSRRAFETLNEMDLESEPESAWTDRVHRVSVQFPTGKHTPRFDPWSEEEKRQLRARYDRDIRGIRESFPTLRFLTP